MSSSFVYVPIKGTKGECKMFPEIEEMLLAYNYLLSLVRIVNPEKGKEFEEEIEEGCELGPEANMSYVINEMSDYLEEVLKKK